MQHTNLPKQSKYPKLYIYTKQSGSKTFKETDTIPLRGLPSLSVPVFPGVLGFIFAMFAGYMYVLQSSQCRNPVHYIQFAHVNYTINRSNS